MPLLSNLNLSDNRISKIEGLANLVKLSTFQVKRNEIGHGGLDDLVGLLECPSISALDLSDNRIADKEMVTEILAKMPNLAVLYMQNNPVCKEIPHYRKTMIISLPTLKYLDDRPVFEDERRFAVAWKRGGLEEERKERALYKKEQEDVHWRRHNEFKAMMERYKQEHEAKLLQESSSDQHSETESIDSKKI